MGRDMEHRAKWEKENLVQISLKLHKETDKDVIDHLNTKPNKRGYLLDLVRKDMREE